MSNFKPPFTASMPLAEAQTLLRPMLDEGHHCPVCTQFAKTYRRSLSSTAARTLIVLHRHGKRDDYTHLATLLPKVAPTLAGRGEATSGHHWGLIVQQAVRRGDGSVNNGHWKLTEFGRAFVLGKAKVPKYARIYDGRCLGYTGDHIDIRDALGKKFRYDELMAGA